MKLIPFSVSNNGFCAWWLSPSGENLLLRRRFLNKMDIFRCDGPREKTRRPLKIMYCCGDARDALERKQDRKVLLRKEYVMQHVKSRTPLKHIPTYISIATNKIKTFKRPLFVYILQVNANCSQLVLNFCLDILSNWCVL